MPETYDIDCHCGVPLQVKLTDAGTSKSCPACGDSLKVPNSRKLKERSGDRYPLLSAIDKVRLTAEKRELPFHGVCHGCEDQQASFETPCHIQVMTERAVADHGGVKLTTSGVQMYAAESEETWETTTFPLLLCHDCQRRFQRHRRNARFYGVLKLLILIGLLVAFLAFVYHNAEIVAALSGVFWLVGAIAWAARFRDSRKCAAYLKKWFQPIRWVLEAL